MFEDQVRASSNFAALPSWREVSGADPYAVRALAGQPAKVPGREGSDASGGAFVGILRGADAVALLDAQAREKARTPAPISPTGLLITPDGEILVSGERDSEVARYRVEGGGGRLERSGSIPVAGALGVRDIALADHTLYALDGVVGRILAVDLAAPDSAPREIDRCRGALQARIAGAHLIVNCLLDHTLRVYPLGDGGLPAAAPVVITHDGPLWSVAAIPDGPGRLLVAAGGVEDHPLDRRDGTFGYVDSFVFLYRVDTGSGVAAGRGVERLAAVNVAALGTVTPKWIEIARVAPIDAGGAAPPDGANHVEAAERIEEDAARSDHEGVITVRTAGYGSDRLVELTFSAAALRGARQGDETIAVSPVVTTRAFPPGTTSVATSAGTAASCSRATDGCASIAADPLLDAWVLVPSTDARDATPSLVPVVRKESGTSAGAARSPESRLGEALFFTTLMSPWGSSDGKLSRFTCETCHHEGYVDGRTHFTGRGDVHATTKPLLSLLSNRPYFSRALDPTMARMVDNEFRVASRGTGHDSWFTLELSDHPWIAGSIPGLPAQLSPVVLRRALMRFLMDFNHVPNPIARGREHFTATEQSGAASFRDRCEGCHAARLVADDPGSTVPFERWEELVLGGGGIVWGRKGYEKTGIEPYVNPRGTRVPSLRRLYVKHPYFTNGSADSLDDVLARIVIVDAPASAPTASESSPSSATVSHQSSAAGRRLTADERAALLAFLRLL